MTPSSKHDVEVTVETAEAASFEDKIAEIDAQLRSISHVAQKLVMQCGELREIFLTSAKRDASKN